MEIVLSDLNWRLTGKDPEGREIDVPFSVPGDNISALLDAGVIPDPYYGENEALCQWPGKTDWRISTVFELSSLPGDEDFFLEIDSIDTCAELWINGKKAGETDNMFIPFRQNITAFLKEGENTLCIGFHPVFDTLEERAQNYYRKMHWSKNLHPFPNMQFIRKVTCHGGWDWGLTLMVCGIGGKACIRTERAVGLLNVIPRQTVVNNKATLEVELEFEVRSPVTFPVTLTFDGERAEKELFLYPGRQSAFFTFEKASPKLWYPAGYGSQDLYDLTVSACGRHISKKIGFRTVELVRERREGEAFSFTFRVNGIDVFCRGANWIPCDAMPRRMTRQKYEDQIRSARFANMNMLRVWGGGYYEADDFYELCDQYGVMVWQDCAFSCLHYPAYPAFLESVEKEVVCQVKRLASFASVLLWCGDNEVFMCQGQTPYAPADFAGCLDYDRLNQTLLRAVRSVDENIIFWNSSPWKGEDLMHKNVNYELAGDTHYWRVWHGGCNFDNYQTVNPSFCSEFGFQSFPTMLAVKRYIPSDGWNVSSPVMDAHQKNSGGNGRIYAMFSRYFNMPDDFENTVYLSLVQQALALETGVEYWRSIKPLCMGTLYWQLNDNWPVASWSTMDYTGSWKAAHYAARRFFAPVMLTARNADDKILLYGVNDTVSTVRGELSAEFHNILTGEVTLLKKESLSLPADRAVLCAELPRPREETSGFFRFVFDGEAHAEKEFFPREYKYYRLPEAQIKADAVKTAEGFELTLCADDYAFFVFVSLTDTLCRFSDDLLTLYPGKAVVLKAETEKDMSAEEFLTRLDIRDLRRTYK